MDVPPIISPHSDYIIMDITPDGEIAEWSVDVEQFEELMQEGGK